MGGACLNGRTGDGCGADLVVNRYGREQVIGLRGQHPLKFFHSRRVRTRRPEQQGVEQIRLDNIVLQGRGDSENVTQISVDTRLTYGYNLS